MRVDVTIAVDAIEVREVHLVCLLSLPAVQAKLCSHLIGEDASLHGCIVYSLS